MNKKMMELYMCVVSFGYAVCLDLYTMVWYIESVYCVGTNHLSLLVICLSLRVNCTERKLFYIF